MARCPQTADLLTWNPPQLVERFDEGSVRAASLRARIARAVSQTLKDCDLSREEVAAAMSEWLGEEVSLHMLQAYCSQAREEHTINFLRVVALVHVTQDARLLQLAAELFDRAVIETRWLGWVEVGQRAAAKVENDKAYESALQQARRGLRA